MPSDIQLQPVEYRGRGTRFNEALCQHFPQMVWDLYHRISAKLDHQPYVFFGHSLGGLIAFELYHLIKRMGKNLPEMVFVAGRNAPSINTDDKLLHLKTDSALKKEIIDIGGTSEEIAQHDELFDVFLPIIRSDYQLIENYDYNQAPKLLDCPTYILNGRDDDESIENNREWLNFAKASEFYLYDGDHFFVDNEKAQIIKLICEKARDHAPLLTSA